MDYKLYVALGFLILANPLQALNYADLGVVDDEIADAIRAPKPLSVTQVLGDITDKYNLTEHTVLNLSGNNISTRGATAILNFIADRDNTLERLDLSYNRIYHEAGEDDPFNAALKRAVALPLLLEINFSGNGIGEFFWLQKVIAELGANSKKIKI